MKILILSFDSLRALLFSGFAMVETKVTALQTLAMINATTKTGFDRAVEPVVLSGRG